MNSANQHLISSIPLRYRAKYAVIGYEYEHGMRVFNRLVAVQAGYIFLTAVWPLIHIDSFMLVTGVKTDIWLAKAVGALLIPISLTLAMFLFISTDKRPALALGSMTAATFIGLDFYYVLNEVISRIYLLDGLIEIVFLTGWFYLAFFQSFPRSRHYMR